MARTWVFSESLAAVQAFCDLASLDLPPDICAGKEVNPPITTAWAVPHPVSPSGWAAPYKHAVPYDGCVLVSTVSLI